MTVGGKNTARHYAAINEAPRADPGALGELCQAPWRWRQTLSPHTPGEGRVRSRPYQQPGLAIYVPVGMPIGELLCRSERPSTGNSGLSDIRARMEDSVAGAIRAARTVEEEWVGRETLTRPPQASERVKVGAPMLGTGGAGRRVK